MKTVVSKLGRITRLGVLTSALLLGQQVLAEGTAANTPVNNRATVGYSVNSVAQTTIESSPSGNSVPGVAIPGAGEDTTFVVDRRVDFQLNLVAVNLTPVNVNDTNQIVEYLLVNTSNSALDFSLSAINAVDGTQPRGADPVDDEDVANIRWHVSAQSDVTAGGSGPDPVLGTDPTDVINLAADDSIRIFVFADIPGTLPDGSVANIELSATAAEPNSGATTLLEETAGTGDPLVVENVWTGGPVGPGVNFIDTQLEGYLISSAALTVTKISDVYSDPINGVSPNAKAIPGAVIQYSVQVANGGGNDATGIVLTDAITSADVTFVEDAYGGVMDVEWDIDGGAASTCDASDNDIANDGCSFDGTNLTVGLAGTLDLDVAAGETLNIRFRVEILPIVP